MRIKECFTISKSGSEDNNEDGIYIGENFISVIDGATSKSTSTIDGVSSGRFAMLAIKEAFASANPLDEPFETIKYLNKFLKDKSKERNLLVNSELPMASVVYCNLIRKEVVSYGDCMYAIGDKVYKQEKISDRNCAIKRAAIIKQALNNGATVESIQENDIGRMAIVQELMLCAKTLANRHTYGGFPCIDGNEPIKEFLKVHKVDFGTPIILASDGYVSLEKNLEHTEKTLNDMLRNDPLCINELLGTKGIQNGNISFDDRTYVSFEL